MKAKKPVSIVLAVSCNVTNTATIRDGSSTEFEYSNNYATHITLAFKPSQELKDFFKPKIGDKVSVTIGRLFYDESAMTYAVAISGENIYFGDSIPHLTVRTAEEVPPSYSNTLLSSKEAKSKCGFLTDDVVSCTIVGMVYGRNGKEYRTVGLKM